MTRETMGSNAKPFPQESTKRTKQKTQRCCVERNLSCERMQFTLEDEAESVNLLLETSPHLHSSGAGRVFSGEPESFGFCNHVVLLFVQLLDMVVAEDDVTAVTIPKRNGANIELWVNDFCIVVGGKIRLQEDHRPGRVEELGQIRRVADAAIHGVTEIAHPIHRPKGTGRRLRPSAFGGNLDLVGWTLINVLRGQV